MAEAPHPVALNSVTLRRGGMVVLADVSFVLSPGHWIVRGCNGSGKSTLLRALAGVAPAASGTITIAGYDLVSDPVRARENLSYAPQSGEMFGYLSVREFLQTVAVVRAWAPAPLLSRAQRWIGLDCMTRRIGTLSAGQRRKLLLCAALGEAPAVIVLDEPEAGLDRDAVLALHEELADLTRRGHTVVHACHTVPGDDRAQAARNGSTAGTVCIANATATLHRA